MLLENIYSTGVTYDHQNISIVQTTDLFDQMSFGQLTLCKSSQHHNNYFRQCFAQAKGSFTFATFAAKTHSAATVDILAFSLP
jgi:hypothetical protein